MAQSKKDYQAMSEELTALIDWFESDEVDLDEAVNKYERAIELLAEMERYLQTAENKIKKINAKFDGA